MVRVINNYILLEIEVENKIGSIYIKSHEKSNIGIIRNINCDDKDLKIGDKILYKDYASVNYNEGNNKYVLVNKEDVIGVIENG